MATLTATFRLIDEMSAKLNAIATSGESAIRKLESVSQATNSAFSTATASASTANSAMDTYEQQIMEAAAATDTLASAGQSAKDALDLYEQQLGDAEMAADELTDAGKDANEALDKQAKAANAAEQEIQQFGEASEDAGRKTEEFGQKSGDSLQTLSNLLVTLGLTRAMRGIYEAFDDCVRASRDFESAITGVYKTVDGSNEQLARIRDDIKEMSTNLPASATAIAHVAEMAGQLGIATDDVTSFTKVMIDLGESTNLSADQAASMLAKFTNITGTDPSQYENLGSAIVALGNNFATTENDIVRTATRMASAGSMGGLNESEILALATAMSSVGIEAEAGGSSMSKLITTIKLAVETGSSDLEDFASTAGMTSEQFVTAFNEDASNALYSFIDGLNDVERNGASAISILDRMGLTEIRLSNTIRSLSMNSGNLKTALDLAGEAWDANSALANEANLRYSTLDSHIAMTKNAAENLKAAIGDDLAPVIGMFADAGRDALVWFTDLVEKHPAISAALTGVAIALGVVTGAITVFSVVVPMVDKAIAALSKTLVANPVFLAITAVAAATAGIVALVTILESQETEYDTWTSGTKRQHDELERLNNEYDRAVETFGKTSDQALGLRYEIDTLTSDFETNKQTLEQFTAQCEKLIEANDRVVDGYMNATRGIDDEQQSAMALIQKLDQLADSSGATVAEQAQIEAIIDNLNASMPDLALSYDKATGSINSSTEALQEFFKVQASNKQHDADVQAYTALLEDQAALKMQLDKVRAERAEAISHKLDVGGMGVWGESKRAHEAVDELDDALDSLTSNYKRNENLLAGIEANLATYAEAAAEAAAATSPLGDAIAMAFEENQAEIDAFAQAYDQAFTSVRSSLDSTIGLFSVMKAETEMSADNMLAAMESQANYLAEYSENIRQAQEYGLNADFISALSDGSAESAGQLGVIVQKIKDLGESSPGAQAVIDKFNELYTKVATGKDDFATNVAKMETDFDTAMDSIGDKLTESVDNMNMAPEAADAARSTMGAYVAELAIQKTKAISMAQATANGVATALKGGASTVNTTTPKTASKNTTKVAAHAAGTPSAEPGLSIVGEEGPELVMFQGGERVFNAPETENILSNQPNRIIALPAPDRVQAETDGARGTELKRIQLDINGSGAIDVTGADEETVWGFVSPRLKAAMMSIIRAEIFEEGERAYGF